MKEITAMVIMDADKAMVVDAVVTAATKAAVEEAPVVATKAIAETAMDAAMKTATKAADEAAAEVESPAVPAFTSKAVAVKAVTAVAVLAAVGVPVPVPAAVGAAVAATKKVMEEDEAAAVAVDAVLRNTKVEEAVVDAEVARVAAAGATAVDTRRNTAAVADDSKSTVVEEAAVDARNTNRTEADARAAAAGATVDAKSRAAVVGRSTKAVAVVVKAAVAGRNRKAVVVVVTVDAAVDEAVAEEEVVVVAATVSRNGAVNGELAIPGDADKIPTRNVGTETPNNGSVLIVGTIDGTKLAVIISVGTKDETVKRDATTPTAIGTVIRTIAGYGLAETEVAVTVSRNGSTNGVPEALGDEETTFTTNVGIAIPANGTDTTAISGRYHEVITSIGSMAETARNVVITPTETIIVIRTIVGSGLVVVVVAMACSVVYSAGAAANGRLDSAINGVARAAGDKDT
jgi:hypothetical protein